ncbi:MAG: ABC transporter ATP-binding protein/permease [Lachnospiraceae bacterium]|nr:ABC transporter ATP-binding protein/permease [Lachnospiraceae bacterium]
MLKLLRFLNKKDWVYVFFVVVFVCLGVFLSLRLPDYMTKVTQLVTTGGSVSEVWRAGLWMLLCAIGDAACTICMGYFSSKVAADFSATLRAAVYNKVVSFSMEEINLFSTSSLLTRSTNDITQIAIMITNCMQSLLRAPIMAVWAFIKITGRDYHYLIVLGIAVLILVGVILSNFKLVVPKFRLIQKLTDNLNKVTRENLTGVRVVRAYNAEDYQQEKFNVANKDLYDNHLFTGKIMAYLPPSMQFVMSMTSLCIYWVGAGLIQNMVNPADKIVMYSELVTFMAYAMQIIGAFMMISFTFLMIPRCLVAAGRVNEVLETETKIKDGTNLDIPKGKGKVEFKNVGFTYPDAEEAVLKNISFTANPGDTVAFIGSTGSGKSTLINLVPRFFDVTEGQILVDGVDVKEYTQKELRSRIGYISQKATLFKGTLRSNVAYGDYGDEVVSDERIIHSLEVAQGKDIITKSEEGIDQEVAQSGTNFSGGQKQRISIARAICKQPEIFIFDDSFSALDYKTDKILRSQLKKETNGATTLIVAQRIGTVRDADLIVVLDEGKVVGEGTHKELLESCDVYQQIARSQLSEEELANA